MYLEIAGLIVVFGVAVAGLRHYWHRELDAHKRTIADLHAQLAEIKKTPVKNSMELTEFLADMRTHGYAFVRVDPDSVFQVGR